MKRFFCSFIILILFLFFVQNLKAQTDIDYFRHTIKTNLFQWTMNEMNVCYEYRFSGKFGIETTVGTYSLIRESFTVPLVEQIPLPHSGFALRVNPKFYFNKNYEINSEYYFSPMILLKRNFSSGNGGHFAAPYEFDEKRWVAGSSLILGYQRIIRNINIDVFIGAGARFRSMQTTYLEALNSPHAPPGNYIGGKYTVSWNEWQPSIHLGIKLGYPFKIIN